MESIPVIDVFAGPGGLNEGFSSVEGLDEQPVFRTVLSIEMESSAVQTLKLRAIQRYLERSASNPEPYSRFLAGELSLKALLADPAMQAAVSHANDEVKQFELSESSRDESDDLISKALDGATDWVLIGGPPCQAYSLAGRSRRTNDTEFEKDHKHFLYREYLHILDRHKPKAFVMENVKGLLSSTNGGDRMFDKIIDDLSKLPSGTEYQLHSMTVAKEDMSYAPEDFVIRAEHYGIPQKRHRIIIVGTRVDGAETTHQAVRPAILDKSDEFVTVEQALDGLPSLRSGLSSPRNLDWDAWKSVRKTAAKYAQGHQKKDLQGLSDLFTDNEVLPLSSDQKANSPSSTHSDAAKELDSWLRSPDDIRTWNHEARNHRFDDLERYFILSALNYSLRPGEPIKKVKNLKTKHWPNHKNITRPDAPFQDRFRVQVKGAPSTTIVSHIAKDGHYYIHFDPRQMRSLTVREAARLQTFPDNYIFTGNRTQQFTQVGNAVPPLLAKKIAQSLYSWLVKA